MLREATHVGYINRNQFLQLWDDGAIEFQHPPTHDVSHTFLTKMLETVAMETKDYHSNREFKEIIDNNEKFTYDLEGPMCFWFGNWRRLAKRMAEPETLGFKQRVSYAWRIICVSGYAERYCKYNPSVSPNNWQYGYLLNLWGDEARSYMERLVADRRFGEGDRAEDWRLYPYKKQQ
jgi:hypothetical protein